MPRFRKRPVEISAHRFFYAQLLDEDGFNALADFISTDPVVIVPQEDGSVKLRIPTLEGDIYADEGDWLIRGVKGELYPCKPDIFEITYEPA